MHYLSFEIGVAHFSNISSLKMAYFLTNFFTPKWLVFEQFPVKEFFELDSLQEKSMQNDNDSIKSRFPLGGIFRAE